MIWLITLLDDEGMTKLTLCPAPTWKLCHWIWVCAVVAVTVTVPLPIPVTVADPLRTCGPDGSAHACGVPASMAETASAITLRLNGKWRVMYEATLCEATLSEYPWASRN